VGAAPSFPSWSNHGHPSPVLLAKQAGCSLCGNGEVEGARDDIAPAPTAIWRSPSYKMPIYTCGYCHCFVSIAISSIRYERSYICSVKFSYSVGALSIRNTAYAKGGSLRPTKALERRCVYTYVQHTYRTSSSLWRLPVLSTSPNSLKRCNISIVVFVSYTSSRHMKSTTTTPDLA
jgi:hypothetical protein